MASVLSDKQLQFINWLVSPDPDKGTQAAFAKRLGVQPTTLSHWKKDAAFRREWEKRHTEAAGGIERAQRLYEELYKIATGQVPGTRPADQRSAIMNYMELTGRYSPKKTLEIKDPRLLDKSNEELLAEMETAKAKVLKLQRPTGKRAAG